MFLSFHDTFIYYGVSAVHRVAGLCPRATEGDLPSENVLSFRQDSGGRSTRAFQGPSLRASRRRSPRARVPDLRLGHSHVPERWWLLSSVAQPGRVDSGRSHVRRFGPEQNRRCSEG